jgi:hypothetical protein
MHKDRVVTREGIHEAEQPIPRGRVDQCMDAWESESVFLTGLVEVGEVRAHPSFPVGLLHQYYIANHSR